MNSLICIKTSNPLDHQRINNVLCSVIEGNVYEAGKNVGDYYGFKVISIFDGDFIGLYLRDNFIYLAEHRDKQINSIFDGDEE